VKLNQSNPCILVKECKQVSISSTFHTQIFCTNFLPKPKHNLKKLPKKTFVQKSARKTLIKLTAGHRGGQTGHLHLGHSIGNPDKVRISWRHRRQVYTDNLDMHFMYCDAASWGVCQKYSIQFCSHVTLNSSLHFLFSIYMILGNNKRIKSKSVKWSKESFNDIN